MVKTVCSQISSNSVYVNSSFCGLYNVVRDGGKLVLAIVEIGMNASENGDIKEQMAGLCFAILDKKVTSSAPEGT